MLSLIEFCIHAVLLGVAGYYVFGQLKDLIRNFSIDVDLTGVQFNLDIEKIAADDIFGNVFMVIQVSIRTLCFDEQLPSFPSYRTFFGTSCSIRFTLYSDTVSLIHQNKTRSLD